MNPELAIDASREAVKLCMLIGGPILGVCLVVGLLLGLAQAMSQIQDTAISAVPKILAVLVAVGLTLPWMSERLGEYAQQQFGTPMFGAVQAQTLPAPEVNSQLVVVPVSNSTRVSSPYFPTLDAEPLAPPTVTPPQATPSENPFQLPHYRFSRRPGENISG